MAGVMPPQAVCLRRECVIAIRIPSQSLNVRRNHAFAGAMSLQELCLRRSGAFARVTPPQQLCLRDCYTHAGSVHAQELCLRNRYVFRERYKRVAALRSQGLCRQQNGAFARFASQLRIRKINRTCMRTIITPETTAAITTTFAHRSLDPWSLDPWTLRPLDPWPFGYWILGPLTIRSLDS